MNVNSPGSVTISGVAVLQSPRAVDPQKGPRNVVFDANFCIVEGSQTVTMALLRYFASNEMAVDIQEMANRPFQKAFIVANIASIPPNSIGSFTSDFEASDYAFIGDIHQLIPFDDNINMQINPYITATGSVATFDSEDRSFTMTPTQYVILTHSTSPFPMHAHFADSSSKKRWGTEGPRVTVGSTISFGGFLERVVRDHTGSIDRPLKFAQIEVAHVAYLAARSNLASSPIQDRNPGTRRRWNWDDLQMTSLSQPSRSSPSSTAGKRKRPDDSEDEKTADDDDAKRSTT